MLPTSGTFMSLIMACDFVLWLCFFGTMCVCCCVKYLVIFHCMLMCVGQQMLREIVFASICWFSLSWILIWFESIWSRVGFMLPWLCSVCYRSSLLCAWWGMRSQQLLGRITAPAMDTEVSLFIHMQQGPTPCFLLFSGARWPSLVLRAH
jgi:hypothetical protein